MEKRLGLMYGALLHDIGKIIYRSNSPEFSRGTHSKLGWEFLSQFDEFKQKPIEESVRFHHYKELSQARISSDSVAYITYIADNIASGIDRKDEIEEGAETSDNQTSKFKFDKTAPLSTIFNVVNGNSDKDELATYTFGTKEYTKYPTKDRKNYSGGDYAGLKTLMDGDLRSKLKYSQHYFNSLLQWTESLWSYVPSSTNIKQLMDVSLYDHSKLTCAIATCIYDYLRENEVEDYKSALFSPYDRTKEFYEQKSFLLMSMDMSGVQDFIYNISGSKALKSLRSRSFYLEIMLEVIVDEFLSSLDLSRANLLYTGGGHAYLLVANTETSKRIISELEQELKFWFLDKFTVDLSVAIAYEECSGNDLMNTYGNYQSLWRNLSQHLSDKKAKKYTAADIIQLSDTHAQGDRECKECLRSDLELTDEGLCSICSSLIHISNDLRDKSFFVIQDNGKLAFPFNKWLTVTNQETAEKLLLEESVHTIYSKNHPYIGQEIATNLWMCDYDAASMDPKTREQGIASYADRKEGIQRLGVLRADIDNLGLTFQKGISKNYNSLSRTATLSRNLSMFFKYEVKNILAGSQVTVIYSGGDDLFLIGAWDDVVMKSIEIRHRFKQFTCERLTFSAGIGIYTPKYPVSKMAFETGLLEEEAKTGNKDKVSLWVPEKTVPWNVLSEDILGDKLATIREEFTNNPEHGKAFIYKVLELLRDGSQINIARLAYLLARSQVSDSTSKRIFSWSRDELERSKMITAFEYYVYEVREGI